MYKFIELYGLVQYNQGRSLPRSGRCEMCTRRAVGVDHCHKHGWIRGELCASHNIRLIAIDYGKDPDRWEPWMIRHYIRCPDCKSALIDELCDVLTSYAGGT